MIFIAGFATAGPKGEPGPSGRDGRKIIITLIRQSRWFFLI